MKKMFENKFKIMLAILLIGIIVFGGWQYFETTQPIDIGNPQKGDFVKVGKMSVPRYNHQAILLDDGGVLVFGGKAENSLIADVYNPNSKQFTCVGSLLKKRGYKNAVNLYNGKILIIGGSDGYPQKATQLFNVSTKKFEIGPDMNYPRGDLSATQLQDGRVLITGGDDFYYLDKRNIPSEIYNPKDNVYDGLHDSIIDDDIFDKTQKLLSGNRIENKNSTSIKNPSLLAGKLFDEHLRIYQN